MALGGYLVDTSVMHRLAVPEVAAQVEKIGVEWPLYRCAIVDLEVLRSAISATDYDARRGALISGFTDLEVTGEVMARALAIERTLAAESRHRGISLADLVVAACAEVSETAVLHYDADYDLIGDATGQPVEWVVPAGTVD